MSTDLFAGMSGAGRGLSLAEWGLTDVRPCEALGREIVSGSGEASQSDVLAILQAMLELLVTMEILSSLGVS